MKEQTKQKIQLRIVCPKCRTSNLVTVNNDWHFVNFACHKCDKNISIYRYEQEDKFTFQEFLDILGLGTDIGILLRILVDHMAYCPPDTICRADSTKCKSCWRRYLKEKFGVQDG